MRNSGQTRKHTDDHDVQVLKMVDFLAAYSDSVVRAYVVLHHPGRKVSGAMEYRPMLTVGAWLEL